MQQTVAPNGDRSSDFERREIDEELSRILESANFRNSPVLQAFLRFIVAKARDGKADRLTEQLIATEVFSRDSDFDCSVDTVVRTHAYRLRQKLNEYYVGPGVDDSILIDVPKGHYRVRFTRRKDDLHLTGSEPAEPVSLPPRKKRIHHWINGACFAVAGLTLLVAGIWLGRQMQSRERAAMESSPAQSAVDQFWTEFLGSDKTPIIAYSNDLYLTTENGNLLMFSGPSADRGTVASRESARQGVPDFGLFRYSGPVYFEDDKTDVGEVVSASLLTAQLVRLGVHPLLKRGRVITTFDLESHNVIFIGSPFANKILTEIEGNANFVFRNAPKTLVWGGAIINLHPLKGEPAAYLLEREANSRAINTDYGVVTSLRGSTPARKILMLGGLTTSGTQAAAQFVTSPAGIAAMSARLAPKGSSRSNLWPAYFEYLLRVRLDRGLDVLSSECLASRTSE